MTHFEERAQQPGVDRQVLLVVVLSTMSKESPEENGAPERIFDISSIVLPPRIATLRGLLSVEDAAGIRAQYIQAGRQALRKSGPFFNTKSR
jgi:hypothetical protein